LAAQSDFSVATSLGEYQVSLGEGQLGAALATADAVLVDEALADRLPPTSRPVIQIASTEEAKTLAGCERVILAMRSAGVRRGDHLVVIGGGVVQDVGTFVADVYMRGLPWSYTPTTLMAMADSCIGGKSSINAGEVKNLVGGIYPPRQVFIDPVFLHSLNADALGSGFSEAAKIAFCRGEQVFDGYLARFADFDSDPSSLIHHVLLAKKWFIEIDEHDQKERRLLNFGHTFGHALESAVHHALPHGLGVSVGILCATEHPASARSEAVAALRRHCLQLLSMAGNTVTHALGQFDSDLFERAFRSDKKHSADAFHLILPAASGGVTEVSIKTDADSWATILSATTGTLETVGSELS
jgi:3-dehydroquinate synthase